MICFKTDDGWPGRLAMNRIGSFGLIWLFSVFLIGIWSVLAWAGQKGEPHGDVGAKVATVVYTCNTWGYLRHCST